MLLVQFITVLDVCAQTVEVPQEEFFVVNIPVIVSSFKSSEVSQAQFFVVNTTVIVSSFKSREVPQAQFFVFNIPVIVSSFRSREVPQAQFFVFNIPVITRVSSFKRSCGTCVGLLFRPRSQPRHSRKVFRSRWT